MFPLRVFNVFFYGIFTYTINLRIFTCIRKSRIFCMIGISLVNTHLLYELARQEQFTHAIDVGTITLDQITSHPFGKCCEPAKFREVLVKQLLPAPFSNRIGRIRRTYMKKSKQIYFSKHAQGLPPIRQQPTGRPTPGSRPPANRDRN